MTRTPTPEEQEIERAQAELAEARRQAEAARTVGQRALDEARRAARKSRLELHRPDKAIAIHGTHGKSRRRKKGKAQRAARKARR